MARTVAVGEQDFSKIIENNFFYIDKTNFIKDWWENGDTVTLITRPRRFGKTLTMSMMEYFFSIRYADRRSLFENLSIWKDETYRNLQGTYPVIFLSFASMKGSDWHTVKRKIYQLIINLYADHAFLVNDGFLKGEDAAFYKRISMEMDAADAENSIGQLSRYLSMYYGKKAIILLDEYDTPMQEAFVNGYWDEAAAFMRGLFHYAFKTNPYLERGIMTGITRISRESVFSDLNNLSVVTVVSKKYADAFGFTEQETFQALEEYGLQDQADEVKHWYDGFRFGDLDSIYNPWSITLFLDTKEFKTYWANTSSNRLVGNLMHKSDADTKLMIEDLLQGKSFFTQIDEEIVFSDLDMKKSAVWSLLLASGYLKALQVIKNRRGKTEYELALTNRESLSIFDEMVTGWFSNKSMDYGEFSEALILGNKEYMNNYLNAIALETFSFFDTGAQPSEVKQPENFYHGFVLGLIADLRNLYKITSNRESGSGRYDVLMEPYDAVTDDGMILEFKVFDPKKERSLADTVRTAIRQILDKKYVAALEGKCSWDRIRIYGIAFQGKKIFVDGGSFREFANALSGTGEREY